MVKFSSFAFLKRTPYSIIMHKCIFNCSTNGLSKKKLNNPFNLSYILKHPTEEIKKNESLPGNVK